MYDPSNVSGRTALITGASTGIGAELARQLAARGATLILVARSIEKLETVAASLRAEYHVEVFTKKLDLSTPDASDRLFQYVGDLGRSIDFLVNNAGVGSLGPAVAMKPEQAATLVNVNLKTVLENTIRFLPTMVARGGGVIINVAGGDELAESLRGSAARVMREHEYALAEHRARHPDAKHRAGEFDVRPPLSAHHVADQDHRIFKNRPVYAASRMSQLRKSSSAAS